MNLSKEKVINDFHKQIYNTVVFTGMFQSNTYTFHEVPTTKKGRDSKKDLQKAARDQYEKIKRYI